MKINIEEFRKRSDYINEQKHPTLDLIIWNYNQHCQFEGAWDEYTLMARGLITDLEGNIVARPFKKFFNYGQQVDLKLPATNPIIYEKLDGSLGIQYPDQRGAPFIATRGSFSSEQAIWATDWLQERLTREDFRPGLTYLYEIIYPENRIVIDYQGKKGLVLLAIIDNETGEELPYLYQEEAKRLGLNYAPHLIYTDLQKIMDESKSLPGNQEGYVFHWPSDQNLRLKIKGDEYVRLHRLITGFSNKSIWELLANGQSFDELLEKVPDEFYQWVKAEMQRQINAHNDLLGETNKDFLICEMHVADDAPRKDWAKQILQMKNPHLLFAKLDKKPLSPLIWKMIKPKFAKPYKVDIDQ